MKASVPLLCVCVGLGPTLPAGRAVAATPQATAWTTAVAAAGQFGAGRAKQAEAEKLLTQARGAIKQGEYEKAEGFIAQAEKVGAKYNPLAERVGVIDTPDKLRKLLAEERSKSGRRPATALASAAAGQQPGTIPADPLKGVNPQAMNQAVDQIAGEGKSRAIMYLNDARAALARRDNLAALAAWQKAAAIGAVFAPNELSPRTVADELIRAGVDPSRLVPANQNPSAPFVLRPADVDPSGERLPQLAGNPANTPPLAAAPGSVTPYNLPPEMSPLANSGPPAGGAYPLPGSAMVPQVAAPPPAVPAALPQPTPLPQRLPVGDADSKATVARLMAQARVALDKGDIRAAAQFAGQAEALNIPDDAFGPGETRPWQMSLEVTRAQYRREGVIQASNNGNATPPAEPKYPVAQGLYDPALDTTRTIPANSQVSVLTQPPGSATPSQGQTLYEEGLKALTEGNREAAIAKFAEAWKYEAQFDPETRQQLKDKLTFLRASGAQPLVPGEQPSPLEQVHSQQDLLRQKLSRELANEEKAAQELAQNDPKQALANLRKFRDRVSSAEIEPAAKKYLLTMVDQRINQLAIYIEHNKSTIESAAQNNAIKAEVVRNQEVNLELQNKLAEMVEQFNKLMDERRFPEAEVLARQARDIAPDEAVVVNMFEKARLAVRIAEDLSIKERSEQGFVEGMMSIGESGIPFDDRNPFIFGDVKKWDQLTRSRARWLKQQNRLSPAEQEIQKSLSKPVEVKFVNRPLSEVMDTLGRMAGVNVYLDPQGLHAEGVTSDTQVTLNLTQPISLKSALNLVLSPLGLSHVVQNEVLRITSEQTTSSNTFAQVYYVGDLVMPIPNFMPSADMGLAGALREGLNALGFGMTPRPTVGPLTMVKNSGDKPATLPTSAEVLAQINQFGPTNGAMPNSPGQRPLVGAGPGGLGGGSGADFDSLIQLITTTIAPQSWDDVGGPGSVEQFDTNLSIVVSQTQDVHEQIADLLEQLRRLQDLQVTIEVRFITLSDTFFERIGVDFDFGIDDNTNLNDDIPALPISPGPGTGTRYFDDSSPSVSIGWTAAGPTADLDIPFTQGSFGSATPAFGVFDQNSAAQFGFAILSDIEVFFLLEAAQGDNRSNILQAPKVTLFNGQFAFVQDQTNRPFVASVIPVVGDFAAAQMPVIVVLSEGTSMSVQAVVSNDRRFVRLTLVPFFSQIGDVDEFTFEGSTTTNSGTTVQDPSNPDQNVTNGASTTVEGTTVQLPTFATTSITTTVSVPDGGTVLLGGIKRLRESRTERGVPLLNKLPWVSRLFRNVGIGREAQSLMMMVTPRIIIQEEEEERLGVELPQ